METSRKKRVNFTQTEKETLPSAVAKLKLETLINYEGAIIKLYDIVKSGSNPQIVTEKESFLRCRRFLEKKQKKKSANEAPKRVQNLKEQTTPIYEEQDDVIVSVTVRINGKKCAAAPNSPKGKRKRRGELDMLHEDIMLMSDDIMTATGKRKCCTGNFGESKSLTTPVIEITSTQRTKCLSEKIDAPVSPDMLKVMSNVRVLIPKISIDALDVVNGGQIYSARRVIKTNRNTAEKERYEGRGDLSEEANPGPATVKSLLETPRKIKKRTNTWANGIIPKRKKKKITRVAEEYKSESTLWKFVKTDKNYFSSKLWRFKIPCMLCDFYGQNITHHYRRKHPESETLSSRLRPEKAEEAIKESLKLNLDETEDRTLSPSQRYPFKCRFCDLDTFSRPSDFYEHISTHTGEYRYLCKLCSFCACNRQGIRSHYLKVHTRNRNDKLPMVRTHIYGYICLECNFVQISRKAVEDHVNTFHRGVGNKICKIHLSSTPREKHRKTLAKLNDEETIKELSNRLLQEETIEPAKTVTIKNGWLDINFDELASKKPLKVIKPAPVGPNNNWKTRPKDVSIVNVVHKLRDTFNDEQQQPLLDEPTTTPVTPLVDEDTRVISAGFINIIQSRDQVEYVCRVPSCHFSAMSRDLFLAHWNEDHTRINQCYKETIVSSERNVFVHVESEHLSMSKEEFVDTEIQQEENPFPFRITNVESLAKAEQL